MVIGEWPLLNKSEHSSQAFVLPPEGSKLVIGL